MSISPFISHKKNAGAIGFFLLAVIVAVFITRLIPAFQSPDEISHLLRADMIAHGQFTLEKMAPHEVGNNGGNTDSHFFSFAQWMQKIVGPDRENLSPAWLMEQSALHGWAHREDFVNVAGTGYYSPLIYTPHAIGLGMSRALDLSMRASYELTRAVVIITVFSLLAWSWSILPPNLLTKMLILMPMSFFQIVSPTIDGLCIALSLLLIALFFARYNELPKYRSPWYGFFLYACIFLLVTSRTNLLPLLALPMILVWRNYSFSRLLSFFALCIACSAWTLYGLLTTADVRVARAFSTFQIISFYVSDPLEFIRIIFNTIFDSEQGYFYIYSFVGILGWLDTHIPRNSMYAVWYCLGAGLIFTAAITRYKINDLFFRSVLLATGVLSVLLVFFALAVTWNDYPIQLIGGVQGRYFIIPAFLGAAAIGPLQQEQSVLRKKLDLLLTLAFAIFSITILTGTLSNRYGLSIF